MVSYTTPASIKASVDAAHGQLSFSVHHQDPFSYPPLITLSSTLIVLCITVFRATFATPLALRDVTTCSPPSAHNVSIGIANLATPDGVRPLELGLESDLDVVLAWVPPATGGVWNLCKSDSGPEYVIHGAHAELITAGSNAQQLWNITCTTCPSDGFATDCTFKTGIIVADRFFSESCIQNELTPELDNEVGNCIPGGSPFQINYHL
ncbi:hypothetical protein DFH08DRAFT_975341 [Mycena albidolilacea]|uniref:Uncharacterized protein n=1 Tax=Mycena albidolilacea TaxID=1033008 RepID=A0AAD6Z5I3_9AGAR|nr:hypothetical protein DFH08DRAFT_975341 [Mycena albidolilacea]